MGIIPAGKKISTEGMRRNSPVKVISQLDPTQVNRRVLGDKVWGLAVLHQIQPQIAVPYLPVDGFVLPSTMDPTVNQRHIYECYRAMTADINKTAFLMARGSKYEEKPGETNTEHCLFEPEDRDRSFERFYAAMLRVFNPQAATAVIGQFMVGKFEKVPKKIEEQFIRLELDHKVYEVGYIKHRLLEIFKNYPDNHFSLGIGCDTVLERSEGVQLVLDRENIEKTAQEVIENIRQLVSTTQFSIAPGQPDERLKATYVIFTLAEYSVEIPLFGYSNTTFYTYAPDPQAPGNILLDLIKGIGFQTLSKNGQTFVFSLRAQDLEIVDYEVFVNQYDRLSNIPRQRKRLSLEVAGETLNFHRHDLEVVSRPPLIFTRDLEEIKRIALLIRSINTFLDWPVVIEGTTFDRQLYLYQLQTGSIDPIIPLKLTKETKKALIISCKVKGTWNGRINLFVHLPLFSRKISSIIPTISELKLQFTDLPPGLFTVLPFAYGDEASGGDELFLGGLSLFATSCSYSPADHVVNYVRDLIKKGKQITFMQEVSLSKDFIQKAKKHADAIIEPIEGEIILVFRNALVESNGSEAQIIFDFEL